jgi:hypothetical protein
MARTLAAVDKTDETVEPHFARTQIARSAVNGAELCLTDKDELVWIDEDGTYSMSRREEATTEEIWRFLGDKAAAADAYRALGLKNVVRL